MLHVWEWLSLQLVAAADLLEGMDQRRYYWQPLCSTPQLASSGPPTGQLDLIDQCLYGVWVDQKHICVDRKESISMTGISSF